MLKIHAFTVSFPPRRFIGSELMTARMLEALAGAGHHMGVNVGDGNGDWTWRGMPISGNALRIPTNADVVIVHAGYSWPGVEYRHRHGVPLVMICHNVSEATRDDLAGARPDLVIVNSQAMADALGVEALIVNPPAPPESPQSSGSSVTALSLNEMKGGRQFWELARRLPDMPFIGIKSGYGAQLAAEPSNALVLDHVPHDQLETVWADTGVFLQLSELESWGMAAAEAIAHGIPVIAHPTPGIVENLADAAVYVDRDDVDGIVTALHTILRDPEPYQRRALDRAAVHRDTSRTQMGAWVSAIERLGNETNQRDRIASGPLRQHA